MKWLMCEEGLRAWLTRVWVEWEAGDEALVKDDCVCYTEESIRVPLKGSIITMELEEGYPMPL